MVDSAVKPMPKEVCCKNWVHLFDYIENTPDLRSGLSGRAAIEKLLEGLIDNPYFQIQDPDDPHLHYPVKEEHLRNKRYWNSNEFSFRMFENAALVIGGFRPLFRAGIIAGYQMFSKAQPSRLQILRLFSPKMASQMVGLINNKFNKTKNPKAVSYAHGYVRIELNYRDAFKKNMSKNVCDWNAGIYTGIGQYTGAHDIRVEETQCLSTGDNDCVFELHWTHLNLFRRILILIYSILDPEYVRGRDLDNLILNDLVSRQEGIIEERTAQLKETQAKLLEAEKRTLEHRITGGFAHEMRNALVGAQLEFRSLMDYKEQGQTVSSAIKEAATSLFENIERLHQKYQVPREDIANEIVPHIKELSMIQSDLSRATEGIYQDIERGLSITEMIREYAKLSEIKPGDEDVDLIALLKGHGAKYAKDFEEHHIQYIFEGPEKLIFKARETHMNSIFTNLIKNARDALVEHSGECKEIRLTVEEKPEGEKPKITAKIHDNGPGIPQEHLNDIFEPFFSTKPSTGTGLGLGTVKRLVTLYQGTIAVLSKEGEGTTFTITFG